MFSTTDLRHGWWTFAGSGAAAPTPEVAALPAGAREVPRPWVFAYREEASWYFDKDEQGAVSTTNRYLDGWHVKDDRARYAGMIATTQVDGVAEGLLAAWPDDERLRGISALRTEAAHLDLAAIERVGAVARITDLDVWGGHRWGADLPGYLAALARCLDLRGLWLERAAWDARAIEALASAPWFGRLDDLQLRSGEVGDEGGARLAKAAGSLRAATLEGLGLGPTAARAWAPRLGSARWLSLAWNPIGDEGLIALIEGGGLASAEELRLGDCGLTDAGLAALGAADLPNLRGLWLHGNAHTDEGVRRIAAAPWFVALTGLSVFGRGVTGPGALAGHALEGAWQGTTRREGVSALVFQGR